MDEARPFASLSSGLLARKGAAKPAMRPQGFGRRQRLRGSRLERHGPPSRSPRSSSGELPEHVPSSIAALTPAPEACRPQADEPASPRWIAQQRAIAESFAARAEAEAAGAESERARAGRSGLPRRRPSPPPRRRAAAEGKAAFTLRLDGERHLRLRLANAVTGRSAQQIVTEALDHFLASIPEVEALAERVPASGGKRS